MAAPQQCFKLDKHHEPITFDPPSNWTSTMSQAPLTHLQTGQIPFSIIIIIIIITGTGNGAIDLYNGLQPAHGPPSHPPVSLQLLTHLLTITPPPLLPSVKIHAIYMQQITCLPASSPQAKLKNYLPSQQCCGAGSFLTGSGYYFHQFRLRLQLL